MLLYITAAFLWVSVWRFQDLWPIIAKLQIPIAIEIVLALTIAANLTQPRRLVAARSRIFTLPFLILALMVVGLPFSLWMGKSFTFITKDFAPSLLLMAGVALGIREADDINWLAFVHLVGGTIYSMWIYLFEPLGSNGRLGDLVYYDANDFCLLVVCAIPFAIYFLRSGVAVWKRAFAAFSLALFVQMVIKSGSRGGFIALIVVALYVLVAFRAIPTSLRLSAVGAAVVLMTVFGSASYWTMMRTILHPKDDYNMTDATGRKFIWKRGIGYMLDHPVLGVGAADFEQAEGTLSAISKQYAAQNKGLKWSTAHNSFVLIGAELGVGGLVLFVTLIGTAFVHLIRIKSGPRGDPVVTPEDVAMAQTLVGALIGFAIAGFFVSATYQSYLYALMGLIAAEDSFRGRRALQARPSSPAPAARAVPVKRKRSVPHGHWVPTG